jgi:electron transfer flavoprotein alpha subunit
LIMNVLVFADCQDGKILKSGIEAVSYASRVVEQFGGTLVTATYGTEDSSELEKLGEVGAETLFVSKTNQGTPWSLTEYLSALVRERNIELVVLSNDFTGKAILGLLGSKLDAGAVNNAVDFPKNENGFTVKSQMFSGKAFGEVRITSSIKIIALLPNAVGTVSNPKSLSIKYFEGDFNSRIKIVEEKKLETGGTVPLPEAELVVSGGRGLKGPENWGIVEDLASTLGATTACSRPVSDLDWRPHHEHVGQTGLAIRPNLYIAIGISGAIQHLAGVNGSKTIVVVNNDPEAPFFKAADYGVVADAFEFIPKFTEALKAHKANNA